MLALYRLHSPLRWLTIDFEQERLVLDYCYSIEQEDRAK